MSTTNLKIVCKKQERKRNKGKKAENFFFLIKMKMGKYDILLHEMVIQL